MPNDVPAKKTSTNAARRATRLQRRLAEIEGELAELLAERTKVTRELAGLWAKLDLPRRTPSEPDTPAARDDDSRPEGNAGVKSQGAAKDANKAATQKK